MQLPHDGVEYAKIVFTSYPTDSGVTVQASFDRSTWFDFDTQPTLQPDGTFIGYVLLRGPDASSTSGNVVPADGAALWVKVTDSPEIIPLRVGIISFY